MNEPTSPMGWHVWRRGALLGLQWLAVFVVVTLILYVLMGVIGWSGVAQALCAMFTGPVIGTALIAVWWLARRPALAAPDQPANGGKSGTAGDQEQESHEQN